MNAKSRRCTLLATTLWHAIHRLWRLFLLLIVTHQLLFEVSRRLLRPSWLRCLRRKGYQLYSTNRHECLDSSNCSGMSASCNGTSPTLHFRQSYCSVPDTYLWLLRHRARLLSSKPLLQLQLINTTMTWQRLLRLWPRACVFLKQAQQLLTIVALHRRPLSLCEQVLEVDIWRCCATGRRIEHVLLIPAGRGAWLLLAERVEGYAIRSGRHA